VAADLAPHSIIEFATGPALRLYVDGKARGADHGIDLFILDGEAARKAEWGSLANSKMSSLTVHQY